MSPMSFSDSNSESIHIHGRHMNQQCDPTVSTDWSTLDQQIITLQEKQNKNTISSKFVKKLIKKKMRKICTEKKAVAHVVRQISSKLEYDSYSGL